MIVQLVSGVLLVIAAYLAIGVVVGVPFLLLGVGRVDPSAKAVPWTFRVLVCPGVVALWPYLMRLWIRSGRAH
jgi:hypothetical protein